MESEHVLYYSIVYKMPLKIRRQRQTHAERSASVADAGARIRDS